MGIIFTTFLIALIFLIIAILLNKSKNIYSQPWEWLFLSSVIISGICLCFTILIALGIIMSFIGMDYDIANRNLYKQKIEQQLILNKNLPTYFSVIDTALQYNMREKKVKLWNSGFMYKNFDRPYYTDTIVLPNSTIEQKTKTELSGHLVVDNGK